jgi:hypothetical protein
MLAACGALVYALAALRGGRDQALWTLAMFATMAMVFVAAGAVMTDPALMLGTTLSMAGYWIAVDGPDRWRRRRVARSSRVSVWDCWRKVPCAVGASRSSAVGAAVLWTRSLRRSWHGCRGDRLARDDRDHRRMVLGRRAATPGIPRILHRRRTLEALSSSRMDWRFVRSGPFAAARNDLVAWIAQQLPWSIGARRPSGASPGAKHRLARVRRRPVARLLRVVGDLADGRVHAGRQHLITYVLPALPAFRLLLGDAWRPD